MLSQILLTMRVSFASWPSCWRYPGTLHREVWLSKQWGRNALSLGLSSLLPRPSSLCLPTFFPSPSSKWIFSEEMIWSTHSYWCADDWQDIMNNHFQGRDAELRLSLKAKKKRPRMVEFQGIAVRLKPLWSHTRWSKTGQAAGDMTIIEPSNVRAKRLLKVCSPER